jgi:hypothetical protein
MAQRDKISWQEMVNRKAEFIGGQVRAPVEFEPGMLCSEISDIEVDSTGYVRVKTSRTLIKLGDGPWQEASSERNYGGIREYVTSPIEQEDGSFSFGITMIRGDIDLYPVGHPTNKPLEDLLKAA